MKKVYFLLFYFTIVITSCTSVDKTKPEKISDVNTDSTTTSITATATPDNSFNSLDWQGTYFGILPCSECNGIETTITLNNGMTFSMTKTHLRKKDSVAIESKGNFLWEKDGGRIVFNGIDKQYSQYLVGENKLVQLDGDGKRITGLYAVQYQLKKSK